MESLDKIGLCHGTDKASNQNNFLQFYDQFLFDRRDRVTSVLEIGVLGGGSLRTWADYFPNARILGMDINPETKQHAGERIEIVIADQSKPDQLAAVAAAYAPFDLIIDDGSHVWDHQILSFKKLFPTLSKQGTYIIEDLDTSYGKYITDYRGGAESAAKFLQRLSDWVVGCRVMDTQKQDDADLAAIWPQVNFVAFSCGTSLIRRR